MKSMPRAVLAVAVGMHIVAGLLFSHHSAVMYDRSREITLEGTVTEYSFFNPHVKIHFQVKNNNGNVENWTAECGSSSMMRRAGWSRRTLKPGDQITASGNPNKDSSYDMRLTKLVLDNGQELIPWKN